MTENRRPCPPRRITASTGTRLLVCLLTLGSLAGPLVMLAQDRNTLLGTNAGSAISAGDDHVIIGYDAGREITTTSENVIIGSQAAIGKLNTQTGEIIPDASLISGDEFKGQRSVIIGYRAAWQSPDLPPDNVIIGALAGKFNRAGDQLIIGFEAGHANTTGTDNTFIGEQAGLHNTTGDRNTYVGENSGGGIATGDNNTAIGKNALSNNGSSTTPSASNGSSYANTAIGAYAGNDIGTAAASWNHTFIGQSAGFDNGAGRANTFVGAFAGAATENSDYNTFVGTAAGWDNNSANGTTTGNHNTYLGTAAGAYNRQGNHNVVIGALADFGSWEAATESQLNTTFRDITATTFATRALGTTGTDISRTVTIGSYASTRNSDGVTIGYSADGTAQRTIAIGSGAQATHDDAIVIGYQAASHGANIAVIGNGTTLSIDPGADGVTRLGSPSYRFASAHANHYVAQADSSANAIIDLEADGGSSNDDRWRIQAANGGDLTLDSFATGSYVAGLTLSNSGDLTIAGEVALNSDARLKTKVQTIENAVGQLQDLSGKQYEWKSGLGRSDGLHFGLIAQAVQEVLPHLVTENDSGMRSVRYHALIPILINALKEQQQRIATQKAEIASLEQADSRAVRQQLNQLRERFAARKQRKPTEQATLVSAN